MKTDGIIDRIYEAALIPEMWEDVLTDMNDVVGTKGATVFTHSQTGSTFIATPAAADYSRQYFDDNFSRVNSRIGRGRRLDHAGFLTDLEVYDESELSDEPLYRDYLYPAGLGWFVGTLIDTPDGDELVVSFDGSFADGPIPRAKAEWLDTLRPHLARALSMTARVKLAMAVKVAEGLGVFGLPACVVNPQGRMLAANDVMHTLIPSMIMDRQQGVTLRHGPSDDLLRRTLRNTTWKDGTADVMSLPVPASDDHPASVVHVIPVCGNGRDLIPGGLFVLAISRLSSAPLPTVSLLKGLFDLTPAEAKVARLAAGGIAPRDIGGHVNISTNTVKVHLKSIYAKTGVNHHAELVRLLSGGHMPDKDAARK